MSETRQIITDKVVLEKTGSTMEEWFRHLDLLGAQKVSSSQILDLINSIEGLAPLGEWNRGLLSTSYQWSRGLRERGQKKGGFEISVSKTVNVVLSTMYEAFVDGAVRKEWLTDDIEITKQTQDKSVRAIWPDGMTRLSVDFYPKGEFKSQAVIQHLKIPDSETAARLKAEWSERLAALKSHLENNRSHL